MENRATSGLHESSPRVRQDASYLGYLAMLVGAAGLFLLINYIGTTQFVQRQASSVSLADVPEKLKVSVHVLVVLVAIVTVGLMLSRLLRYLGQPPVIGEVLAGILLGPSLLGRLFPDVAATVFPQEVGPYISVISELGIIIYMFLVGLEFNPQSIKNRVKSTVGIAHASMVVPFVGGAALGLMLYPQYSDKGTSFTIFALFMGVALSITAFPVLARILTDRQMQTTPLGVVALSAAAIGDLTAWCMLACVVGIAKGDPGDAVFTLVLSCLFVAGMLLLVKPILERVLVRYGDQPLSPVVMAIILVAILASALITEQIGIHALFGAFLMGVIIPHDSQLSHTFRSKTEDFVSVLLLPAFFASVGMRTQIGLVSSATEWLICGAIIGVAIAGKFLGTYGAARLASLDRRNALGLSALMNTRGLMELIVLNIGLEMKIISPTLFTMMVLMAIVTTATTGPLLKLLGIGGKGQLA